MWHPRQPTIITTSTTGTIITIILLTDSPYPLDILITPTVILVVHYRCHPYIPMDMVPSHLPGANRRVFVPDPVLAVCHPDQMSSRYLLRQLAMLRAPVRIPPPTGTNENGKET